ncbi:uncharacterized protein LOC144427293 [Styela clava]
MEIVFGKHHCEIGIKHLDYGQVIGGVRYAPSGLLKLLEMGRAVGSELFRRLCDSAGEEHNHMIFLKWQQVEILPSFYKKEADPDDPTTSIDFVNQKKRMFHFFLPISNTSRRIENWVFDSGTGTPIMTASVLSVNINPETRRPLRFNNYLKNYFSPKNLSSANMQFQKLPPSCMSEYKMPDSVLFHSLPTQITVRYVDRNGHTNQSAYGDICYNCLADAISKKVFFLFGSIFDYKIRRMSFLYLKESLLGDKVEAIVWQDESHNWKFKFHIKKDGIVLCQAEFMFYPELKAKI